MRLSRSRIALFLSTLLCLGAAQAAAEQEPAAASPKTIAAPTLAKPTPQPAVTYSATNLNRVGVQTAQPLPLTLQDAIKRALESNNDIEVTRDDVRFQETQIRAILGIYDPVFTIQPQYNHTSSTGSTATNNFGVNANFSQLVQKSGGNYQVFFNNSRTESAFAQAQLTSGSFSSSSAIYSSGSGVSFSQPLLRNRKIDNNRRNLYIARRRLEQTDAAFRLQATTTITLTQRAYWDFVFALRDQQNTVANVNLAEENLRQIEAKIQAGASAPLERAEVATELANRQGDLLLATQQVAIAENTLKQLVLRDPTSAEWTETFVPTDEPTVGLTPVSLDAALNDAVANRYELKRLKLQQEMNQEDLKFYKDQLKPQIDFNSTFSLNGISESGTNTIITTPTITSASDLLLLNSINATRTSLGLSPITNPSIVIPASPGFLFGGFNQSLANLFRTDAPNFTLGATISFPLHNRTAKANLDSARVTEHQLDAQVRGQENTVIVEVRNAVQNVETTRQRYDYAKQARENAEIELAGEQKLYESGRSTTFLLFQRENTLTNARNAEIRAQTDYRKSLADLQQSTATTFRDNNIKVAGPVPIPPK